MPGEGNFFFDLHWSVIGSTALWLGNSRRSDAVVGVGVVPISPEHVVFVVKDISYSWDLGSVLVVALAESSFASIWRVGTLDFTLAALFPLVADELADALGSELHLHTLLAIFVSFADVVQFVNRSTVSWVAHRSIAENQAVAAISPVLSLVKVGHVVKGEEL